MSVEHVEPDYPTAADAWLSLEMTKLSMRYNHECVKIAREYERRLAAERKLTLHVDGCTLPGDHEGLCDVGGEQ